MFGGFVKAVFIVFEQVRKLQELMLSILDVSCLTGLEAGLEGGVNLQPGGRRLYSLNKRQSETNLLDLLDGGVCEVSHAGGSRLSWNRQNMA